MEHAYSKIRIIINNTNSHEIMYTGQWFCTICALYKIYKDTHYCNNVFETANENQPKEK